jgi:hypothetical protein
MAFSSHSQHVGRQNSRQSLSIFYNKPLRPDQLPPNLLAFAAKEEGCANG